MDNRCSQRQHMRVRLRTGQCAHKNGPGGAGLTRATEPANLRCPRCDEDMPDTNQLLDHIRGHLDLAFPWMAAKQTNRSTRQVVGSSRTEVEQLAVASAKAVIGLEGRMRVLEGVTSRTFLLPKGHSLGRAGVAAGVSYFEAVQAAGKNHTHGQPYQWIFAAILASVESHMSQGPEKEKIQTMIQVHTGRGSAHVQGQSSVVHVQGAVQERGIRSADDSYAERSRIHGDDRTMHLGDRRRGENWASPAGPSGTTPGQATERPGSVGGAHVSSTSGAGVVWGYRSDRTLNHDSGTSMAGVSGRAEQE